MEVQRLLMPMILQLTPEQQIEYARIADELRVSGFETEPFGNRTIAVKAAPASIGLGRSGRVILEILEIAENELRSVSLSDLRRGIAASIACRAAIKINTPLDQQKDGMDAADPGRDRVSRWPARTGGPWRCSTGPARFCGPSTASEMLLGRFQLFFERLPRPGPA